MDKRHPRRILSDYQNHKTRWARLSAKSRPSCDTKHSIHKDSTETDGSNVV